MSSVNSIVNKILLENDSESPEAYLKWLVAQRDEEARVDELVKAELGELGFGFAIHTSDEDTVQANAVEAGIDFEAVGDQLAHDFTQIERNAMRLLANSGFTLRSEGYGSDGALCGSCWLTNRLVLENILQVIYGPREWPSTSAGTMDGFFPYKDQHGRASATTALYAGVSEPGQRLIEVFIEFFATDKLKDWAESHNLGESLEDEDAPESFIQHYAPRLNGRLFIQRLRKATGTTLSSVTMENAPAGFNLTESAGEDDPALNIPRHTDAIHDETLQAAIDSALADFEHVVIQQNVGDSRRADELAGEITANWINNVGYDSELHPDECEAILTALYKRAGELFPLNWEDSEEPYPVDETKALPSETVLPESGTKPVEGETLRGIDLVKRLLQIGTAQGGFLNFTLKEIRQRNYRLTSVDVRELAKTDNSFADYADSGEKREYRGDLRSTEDSNVELPAVDLFDEPIVVIDGMVRDGWSRAAAHLKAGEFQVQAWVAEPVVPEAAKAITTELGAPVNEAQEDDDAVDPREYALSCPVFDREKLKKALAEAGWRYAFTRTLDTQWELGWDSTKVAHWGSTRDEQVYEGDRAAAEVEEIVKRVVPGACDFRFTSMLGRDRALSHFSLVFRIPPNVRVIHKLNHESQDDDIDPAKYIDDTFDINAVMSRLCFVFSDQDNAWIKIYAGRPNNRPDAMIAVSVHGGAPDVDRTYDTIVYIAKEDRDYVPVAYRWSRLAKELPVVIGHLERKIRAGDDSQLRESAPDPNDLDDPEAVLRQQSKDLVDYTMKQLGFKGCGSADQVEGFTLWRNEYPGADGKKHWLLVSTCLAGGSPMYVRPMEPETNGWGDALTVHPKSPAHQALIIRDVDAAMQRSADDGLVGEAEVQALKRVLQHHGEVNKN